MGYFRVHLSQKWTLRQRSECKCFTWEVTPGSTSREKGRRGRVCWWVFATLGDWASVLLRTLGCCAEHASECPAPAHCRLRAASGHQLPGPPSLHCVPGEHGPVAKELPQAGSRMCLQWEAISTCENCESEGTWARHATQTSSFVHVHFVSVRSVIISTEIPLPLQSSSWSGRCTSATKSESGQFSSAHSKENATDCRSTC